jgi:hypothetical protein
MDDIHQFLDFRVVNKKSFYNTAVRAVKGSLIRRIIPGVEHIKDRVAHMMFSIFFKFDGKFTGIRNITACKERVVDLHAVQGKNLQG